MKQRRKSTPRPRWERGELDFLQLHYASMSNMDLSKNLGRSVKAIMQMAQKYQLKKGIEYRREMGRLNVSGRYAVSEPVGADQP
jgi:hypothetical protein